MIDLTSFLDAAAAIVRRCRRGGAGRYARTPHADAPNPYGSADAANLLYTLGAFPPWPEHGAWIAALQGYQDVATGLFEDDTHHPIHTTAHVLGALELFGATAARPLVALAPWRDATAVDAFLGGLDWTWNPWGESHRGAGLYAALLLGGNADATWEERYFAWLASEADPDSGLWRRGCIEQGGEAMLFHHLAGTFHYLFNHEHARRPLPYPEALVDTCLRVRRDASFPPLGRTIGYAELDWVYCAHRAARQSGHRLGEVRTALAEFAREYTAFLGSLDPVADPGLLDLHQLLGCVSALAELQRALPGVVRTARPLRLVLDRRPFI